MPHSIAVQGLSKQFHIGRIHQETMLREKLVNLARGAFGARREMSDTLWALREVSFSIEEGEVVGIIGRNGAGKSTLLKILARITFPTAGRLSVHGRVASLLEVGTGFHEELTGRENIFLNGSILGMKRREVEEKLDAIVSFAGVEQFIDTPIKRYSSGMRLRLGFAVAAHLDPDILIIDEVLAVGDAGFQKKCLNVMGDLRRSGRTVLFVSHNMAAVENLCSRTIWIDSGRIREDGPTRRVIEQYMGSFGGGDSADGFAGAESRRGTGLIQYTKVEFLGADHQPKGLIRSGDSLILRLHYHAWEPIPFPSFGFRMYTDLGTLVTDTSTWAHGIEIPLLPPGDGYVDLEIGLLNLLAGRYHLSLWLSGAGGSTMVHDCLENCTRLEVEPGNIYRSGKVIDGRYGMLYFPQKWNLDQLGAAAHLPPVVCSS
jgi:lipopolysaccharide transport system ATP-binding protein